MLGAIALMVALSAPVPVNVPELLKCEDGSKVATSEQWETKRRGEIFEFFMREEYGRRPVERPEGLKFELAEPDKEIGDALRKRIRVSWQGPLGSGSFVFSAFIPKRNVAAKHPSPAFLLICNRNPAENIDPERKVFSPFWPVEEIIDRGYAAIAFYNGDLAIDNKDTAFTAGVAPCYAQDRGKDTWGALSCWAWGASRVMDWIETEPLLDAKRVGVVGHSRGGKTALLTGVTDRRFAMACSNDSGCSGAKLNHIDLPRSEPLKTICHYFPHWFSPEYLKWVDREKEMPYDQHEFIALMAPRLVCIASATNDDWAGQLGEFYAAQYASPAWELYGLKGLVAPAVPPLSGDRPADGVVFQDGCISYHIRTGKHTLGSYDWHRYLDFADKHGWRN